MITEREFRENLKKALPRLRWTCHRLTGPPGWRYATGKGAFKAFALHVTWMKTDMGMWLYRLRVLGPKGFVAKEVQMQSLYNACEHAVVCLRAESQRTAEVAEELLMSMI